MKNEKLVFEKMKIFVSDRENVINWMVEFSGNSGNLKSKLYKNGDLVASYTHKIGHACKSKALDLIKSFINKEL